MLRTFFTNCTNEKKTTRTINLDTYYKEFTTCYGERHKLFLDKIEKELEFLEHAINNPRDEQVKRKFLEDNVAPPSIR